jgi:hypothetical protein
MSTSVYATKHISPGTQQGVDYGDDLEMTTNQQYPPNEDGNGNGNDHTSE